MGKGASILNYIMKKTSYFFVLIFFVFLKAEAQFVVSDPMHTGVTTLIKLITDPSFKEIVKDIEKLKKVTSAVRQFHRGTEIIQTIGHCTNKMSNLSAAVSRDGHIYPAEYALMVQDMTKIAESGTNIIKDMKAATSQSGSVLQMTDAERVKWLNDTFDKVKAFEHMIDKYFAKIKTTSMRRSGNLRDLESTNKLYNLAAITPEINSGGAIGVTMANNGYDATYSNTPSVLEDPYNTQEAKDLRALQAQCAVRMQNYYDEKMVREMEMEVEAFYNLMNKGWDYITKKPKFTLNTIMQMNLFSTIQGAVDDVNNMNTLNGTSGGVTSEQLTATMEDAIEGFVDPSGKKVSNENFMIYMRMEARQLFLEKGVDQLLRSKWKLEECQNMGKF
jgi:hypothetical protein